MARSDETAPDPAAVLRLARQALSSAEFRRKFHTVDFWGPKEFYDPQLRFFAAGAKYHQRLIRGGNQVGKSFSAAFEASLHMTGAYPTWWQGRRFAKPTRGWVIGPTAQLVRDGPQRQLCSKAGEFGTGTIPLSAFTGRPVMVPGGTGSIDTLSVAHHTNGTRDGVSTCTMKSFEMRSEKMQSESVDWIWIDERCSEEIYSELLARTTATDGILFLSYTPLKGGGELTYRFLNEYSSDRSDTRIEASDARHISPERRAQLEESYLPEVYRRLGAPMLPKHAENKGGGIHVEPAIEELCSYMKRGCFTIANHMSEFGEEFLNYHRDEDYKIVTLRDDLLSSMRYAFMMRRNGKQLDTCESYGRAPGVGPPEVWNPRPSPRSNNRANQVADDWDVFTGEPL
jgi:phage terminase large subunit-like protein